MRDRLSLHAAATTTAVLVHVGICTHLLLRVSRRPGASKVYARFPVHWEFMDDGDWLSDQ